MHTKATQRPLGGEIHTPSPSPPPVPSPPRTHSEGAAGREVCGSVRRKLGSLLPTRYRYWPISNIILPVLPYCPNTPLKSPGQARVLKEKRLVWILWKEGYAVNTSKSILVTGGTWSKGTDKTTQWAWFGPYQILRATEPQMTGNQYDISPVP